MYQIIISDDDQSFLKEAAVETAALMEHNGIRQGIDYELLTFNEPQRLIDYLHQNKDACQLLMLDVEFGSKNGLTIMKELREQELKCGLIYLTNYRDYVYDCFDTQPLYYMLKPIDWQKLGDVILKNYHEHYQGSKLNLKLSGKHVMLAYDDIYALEATSHKVCIWLKDSQLAWNGTLSAIEQHLPSHLFCRCHNSFLVNLKHIQELDRKEIKMDNGARFPVSKRLYATALRQYFAYLKN